MSHTQYMIGSKVISKLFVFPRISPSKNPDEVEDAASCKRKADNGDEDAMLSSRAGEFGYSEKEEECDRERDQHFVYGQ